MKNSSSTTTEDMRAEYDFTDGVVGKYADRYEEGTNVVVLEPDVARAFPTAASVNSSLRALARSMREGEKAGTASSA